MGGRKLLKKLKSNICGFRYGQFIVTEKKENSNNGNNINNDNNDDDNYWYNNGNHDNNIIIYETKDAQCNCSPQSVPKQRNDIICPVSNTGLSSLGQLS